MDLKQLRTFLAVARHLSFHRAARELHYVQSSVSVQIQALEEELGVRLFDRLGRRTLLTEAGQKLVNYAQKLTDLVEETRAELGGEAAAKGSLTIRVPESFCVHRLPLTIRRYRAELPGVGLNFIACALEGLQEDLRKGVTDLAFVYIDSIQAADLEAEMMGQERLWLVAGPEHPLVGSNLLGMADLAGQTVLASRVDCSYRRLWEGLLTEARVRPGTLLELNSVAAIKACLAQGLGIALLPAVAVGQEVAAGRLARLSWSENDLEVPCLMVWHRKKWLSPALRGFMATVRETMPEVYGAAGA